MSDTAHPHDSTSKNMRGLSGLALALLLQVSLAHAVGDAKVGDPVAGKASFAKCASCHQVGPNARGGFGPQLTGVIGRPAGSTRDFNYSDAMKNANFVWTEAKLRAFLKSTDAVVPGNKMRFWGIGSEQELSDLLAYLHTFDRPQK
jgi:cytochrome c